MSPFTSAGLQIYLGPGLSTVEGTSVTRSTLSRDALRYFLEFTYRWFGCGSHNWFAYSNNFLLIKPYADWRRLPRDVPSVQAVKPRSHQSERLVRRRVPPARTPWTRKVANDDVSHTFQSTISNDGCFLHLFCRLHYSLFIHRPVRCNRMGSLPLHHSPRSPYFSVSRRNRAPGLKCCLLEHRRGNPRPTRSIAPTPRL